jgi:hypothetical protein
MAGAAPPWPLNGSKRQSVKSRRLPSRIAYLQEKESSRLSNAFGLPFKQQRPEKNFPRGAVPASIRDAILLRPADARLAGLVFVNADSR